MAYREYIEKLRAEFEGKHVVYEGRRYNVAMVDYNGIISSITKNIQNVLFGKADLTKKPFITIKVTVQIGNNVGHSLLLFCVFG